MKTKAQVSVEFLIVLTILFGILLLSNAIFGSNTRDLALIKQGEEAKIIAHNTGRTINAIYLAGSGSSTQIVFEQSFDYNVLVENNAVRIEWETQFSDSPLLTGNIIFGEISPGSTARVWNDNGVVKIEKL